MKRNRRKDFAEALRRSGVSVTEWTARFRGKNGKVGVSLTHLHKVLDGERVPSAELEAAINETICGEPSEQQQSAA